MNKVIILSELSKTIAELTECSAADAENFVRELFVLAADRLEADSEVYIPEVGLFKLTDDTIEFAPDSELAAAINAPFAAFEAVELPDDMDLEDESEEVAADHFEEPEPASPEPIEETPEETIEDEQQPIAEPEPESEPQPQPQSQQEPEPIAEPEQVSEPEVVAEQDSERKSFGWILWLLLCGLCFAAGWYFGQQQVIAETKEPEEVANADTPVTEPEIIETELESECEPETECEPEPVPEPETETTPVVTDTIKPGRFLTTMARQHYGQMDYWVYIYKENAAILGHPDRLSGGTVVVIPPAEKYGLVAGDDVKISEASRLAREIYERFN